MPQRGSNPRATERADAECAPFEPRCAGSFNKPAFTIGGPSTLDELRGVALLTESDPQVAALAETSAALPTPHEQWEHEL